MDVNRVTEMEGILNDCSAAADRLASGIEGVEQIGERMKKLFSYYGSEDWYEDLEGTLPEGLPAGVLSEDAVYDLIGSVRDLAIRMLELSTDILKAIPHNLTH